MTLKTSCCMLKLRTTNLGYLKDEPQKNIESNSNFYLK